jgi:hypothetical protein
MVAGFVEGTRVRYHNAAGVPEFQFSSVSACFASESAAMAQYEEWGPLADGCVDSNLSLYPAEDVPLGTTIGDASKARFCSAEGHDALTRPSLALYVQDGSVLFTLRYETGYVDFAPDDPVKDVLVQAAMAIDARLQP